MKYSKPVARSRHLKARNVSLKKHLYSLFESDPSFTMGGPDRKTLLVVGYRQTGVTTTLYDIAISLVRETPKPVSKKRHLLLVRDDVRSDHVWQGLYGTLLTGNPGLGKLGPRTSEAGLKNWLKGYDFDMIVEGPFTKTMFDASKYEIIHEICDLHTIGMTFPDRTRDHLGMKCIGVQAFSPNNPVAVSCPVQLTARAGIILETVPPQPTDDQPRVKVQVDKYRGHPAGSFIGKEFVITTFPKVIHGEGE